MALRDTAGKGLVDRRAEQTRADIFTAAIELFVARGFDDTSMADVAEAAGVSRRTLYRYYATKDDIVYEAPRRWLERFDEVVAERHPGESTRELFRRALVEVAAFVEDDAERVLRAYRVVTSSPGLAGRHGRSDAEWVQRYLELIGPDVATLEDGDLQAAVVATALVAAQNALIAVWAASHPERDAPTLMRQVLDQLDSAWPAPCREPRR